MGTICDVDKYSRHGPLDTTSDSTVVLNLRWALCVVSRDRCKGKEFIELVASRLSNPLLASVRSEMILILY